MNTAFKISAIALAALAAGAAYAKDWPSGYSACATEGNACHIGAAPRSVSFGARGKWVEKSLSGDVACTVQSFGSDPAPGKAKKCAVGPTAYSSAGIQTQWGLVTEPSLPATVCGQPLQAQIAPTDGSVDGLDADPRMSQPDTARIQRAIDACPAGQAVKLVAGAAGASGFLTGPLRLRSGVTLWIDDGVTLFGSRNPADYDTGAGTCGTAIQKKAKSCAPLVSAPSTVGSGIVGGGSIDGRGGSLLTSGPNAGRRSWWDVAFQNKTQGLYQQNPRLIEVAQGSDFLLYRVAVLNSPNFHIVTSGVDGVTAWGIKILSPSRVYTRPGYACPPGSTPDRVTPATCFTPETVKNTDGFDPGLSQRVLLAYSYISTGDDHVAVKSSGSGTSRFLHFASNHLYYGHGLSIGSELDAGVSNVVVTDLTVDGQDSDGSIGLRIKSDSSRGGPIDTVSYSGVCMRNVRRPLVFDAFYSDATGRLYPRITNIRIAGMHNLGSQAFGGGALTFAGYRGRGPDYPITVTLDNVVFDQSPTFEPSKYSGSGVAPEATHFTFGPGPVSFAGAIYPSPQNDVTVSGAPGRGAPIDCSAAFVPLQAVLPASPI